jgi:hypothetical protein
MTLAQSFQIGNPTYSTSPQEIDVELFAFIERYATNLARWDLLLYFGQNPNARGNAWYIAERIGRKISTVQKELDDLVYLGVVQADRTNHITQYTLARAINTRRAAVRMARDVSMTR